MLKVWDANIYIQLAQNGYQNTGDAANFIVFQPLFPKVLELFTSVFNFNLISIELVVITISILALFSFYKLATITTKQPLVATILLLTFPLSFFLFVPYAEGLFLLLSSLAMYFGLKKRWLLIGVLAGLATITRPFGILISISFIISAIFNRKPLRNVVSLCLPTFLAVSYYLFLNYQLFGDMFMFKTILSEHWYKTPAFPLTAIKASWLRLFNDNPDLYYKWMIGGAEALTATLSWLLVPFAFKNLKRPLFIYYLLAIIMMTSTGFLLSTPRYLLSIPPFFILLSKIIKKRQFVAVYSILGLTIGLFLLLRFTSNQWAF